MCNSDRSKSASQPSKASTFSEAKWPAADSMLFFLNTWLPPGGAALCVPDLPLPSCAPDLASPLPAPPPLPSPDEGAPLPPPLDDPPPLDPVDETPVAASARAAGLNRSSVDYSVVETYLGPLWPY